MPPPSSQRADIEPPEEITTEAVRGFLTGAFRFGSVSILAHMIMILPHPFKFSSSTAAGTGPSHPPVQPHLQEHRRRPPRPSPFSQEFIRSRLFYQPLEGVSEWLSPTARIYRGLTLQFKVFLQIAAMTLGGCIYAERRVNDYINMIRKVKRAERLQAQREAR
ncbi:hypothetical protein P175DRAFT_0503534 [Aspergillus ochraceoroseus IBT 24754]|uniref:Uncharacterized protein n=3 Tax=Aspergillus subgen. Nidulantes TaxID=2720870 RepID=A0A0F8VFW5_9EURO|nr:uncharacterized protein P175DRAFT_0503534 [Aspergillus ochraceoroseus IBT 24754]KKK22016.1 hypothetical protein ARAM_002118 [Aspergillus rambellii]KKK22044.1 hypothetical protein AOCH_007358 [Aspergillus ochraceoroseus]PTU18728.1 hypothetical protein P175DRAFT_0503534 [Aspergillus ochraceoroseus IBT 24754]